MLGVRIVCTFFTLLLLATAKLSVRPCDDSDPLTLLTECLSSTSSTLSTSVTVQGLSQPLFWIFEFSYSDGSSFRQRDEPGVPQHEHTFSQQSLDEVPSVVVSIFSVFGDGDEPESSFSSQSSEFVIVGNFSCYRDCGPEGPCSTSEVSDRCCSGTCCSRPGSPSSYCSVCTSPTDVVSSTPSLCCSSKNLSCTIKSSSKDPICCDAVDHVCEDLGPGHSDYCCAGLTGRYKNKSFSCCFGECCDDDTVCLGNNLHCCKKNSVCGGGGLCCGDDEICCGDPLSENSTCAKADQCCEGGLYCSTSQCCESNRSCCLISEQCQSDRCCLKTDVCSNKCCDGAGESCSGDGKCCDKMKICADGTCCSDRTDSSCYGGKCCLRSQQCDNVCCDSSTHGCSKSGKCCLKSQICTDGSCCDKAGYACSGGVCCPKADICSGKCCSGSSESCYPSTNPTCCPKTKICGGVCCNKPGFSCYGGKCCPTAAQCDGVCCEFSAKSCYKGKCCDKTLQCGASCCSTRCSGNTCCPFGKICGSCETLAAGSGQLKTCPLSKQTAITAICTAGEDADCSNSYFHETCCQSASSAAVATKTYGCTYHNWCSCPTTMPVMVGGCGSGSDPVCKGNYYQIVCASSDYVIDQSSCVWKCARWGQTITCDAGKIATGMCASGTDNDCGRYLPQGVCGGGGGKGGGPAQYWGALKCCKFH